MKLSASNQHIAEPQLDSLLQLGGEKAIALHVLWRDSERVLCRGWRTHDDGSRDSVLVVYPASEHAPSEVLDRLAHEYRLKDMLDDASVVRPIGLERSSGKSVLVLEDPGGEPLAYQIGPPMAVSRFLSLAIGLAAALGRVHGRGLIHKDIKPSNVLIDLATSDVWLTGFGLASRVPRERHSPVPPEMIAGTFAYMAPEQTGRMNRSVDIRSDLYSLGVTFYEMLTGVLPFAATDPMEWFHCHIARKPAAPIERVGGIPEQVSAIVMKLLAKAAEDRYQTAAGLQSDLQRCLAEWDACQGIRPFPLGESDASNQLLFREKLYGREAEMGQLIAAFDRVTRGASELVLISGYSGVGKSSVVNELHKTLVPNRGFLAIGKFDQYRLGIPYATLSQAFQSLVRQLLSKRDSELDSWRNSIAEALGPNGQLMINLVPELALIVGEQPPAPDLSGPEAQRRFLLLCREFLKVFARPEHPLVLFLDDLQWLDSATLDVFEHLATEGAVQNLLLVGAYRQNEVDVAHPLTRRLGIIHGTGRQVQRITLGPIRQDDVRRMIADTLDVKQQTVAPLARTVFEKTGGNPFFIIQFISALADEGLLEFDLQESVWRWSINHIRARSVTDNVADLMVQRLRRFPDASLECLKLLACLGGSVETTKLCRLIEASKEEIQALLYDALRAGLLAQIDDAYAFTHDRVQEAAYALFSDAERAHAHLRLGRQIMTQTLPEKREEATFDIVDQLNRGMTAITARNEMDQLAQLNLKAASRAKNSTAYAAAMDYIGIGIALLGKDRWERNYTVAFALDMMQAECEYLSGDIAAAEAHLDRLAQRSDSIIDRAAVACLQIELYTNLGQTGRAIAIAEEFFERSGMPWNPQPSDSDVNLEIDQIWLQLGSRPIERLIDLPPIADTTQSAILDVLTAVHAPANFSDGNLIALIIARMVNLSIKYGNSDGSPLGYVFLGMILASRFEDYSSGFQFGKVGIDLVERLEGHRYKPHAYLNFGNAINPWSRHVNTSFELLQTALKTANESGYLTFAAYSYTNLISAYLFSGHPLQDVLRFAQSALDIVEGTGFRAGGDLIRGHVGLLRSLSRLTPDLSSFNYEEFEESQFEQDLADSRNSMSACWYWIRKLQAYFFADDHAAALIAASKAERLLWTSPGFLISADYHFYGALACAAYCTTAPRDEFGPLLTKLKAHQRQIETWADACAANFEHCSLLVSAEIARLEGRELEAMRLYERAIHSAQANGFVHNEALANELAGRFYATRGYETPGYAYLRNARYCYLRWGAGGKVDQLDAMYPRLREESVSWPTSSIASPVEHLDLRTVIKVSQAITGEIVLERLLDTLLRIAIEHAGAERALLILSRNDDYRIEAEATTEGDVVTIGLRQKIVTGADLPESVLYYSARTKESVLLNDASAENPFSTDEYIRQYHARSILCLPLLRQAKLIGLLYLENNLAEHTFTPARIAVLKLLASLAAVSLENTSLYRDLAEREARIRRLVESDIIGIVIWDLDGRLLDANDAFLSMLGYERNDLSAGLRWFNMTPPEWQEAHILEEAEEIRTTGMMRVREKEFFRKDGSRVPVLIGAAAFGGQPDQGVAYILDLTERKRAEEAARESERRYREVQMELAHANRVTTMGQLTGSIAHEVNQPIAATIVGAQAALRWLDRQPPDLEEVKQLLAQIVQNGTRAGEVIHRIRALIKKEPQQHDVLEINGPIRDVIELTRNEARKNRVSVTTELADSLPRVRGDRVQVQQVMLNLIVNAVEAMSGVGEGSRDVVIRTGRVESGAVLVVVRDTGPGLEPESVERVFEAFYTTKSSGMGMGLSICRSIIEAHGGKIWASANFPRGAVFQFTLPAWDGNESSSDP